MRETVEQAVAAFYDALSRNDFTELEQRLLRGPENVHIGSGAAYWMSGDALFASLRMQAEEVAIQWRGGDAVVGERGNAAWVGDRPALQFEDGSALECRVTLVFVLEGTRWMLAHSHMSVGTG